MLARRSAAISVKVAWLRCQHSCKDEAGRLECCTAQSCPRRPARPAPRSRPAPQRSSNMSDEEYAEEDSVSK